MKFILCLWYKMFWKQCSGKIKVTRIKTSYCIKHKSHFGKCRTLDGTLFDKEK